MSEEMAIKIEARRIIEAVKEALAKPEPQIDEQCRKLLNELYCQIWCEACYDPYNESTSTWARERLLKPIQELNKILRFKT